MTANAIRQLNAAATPPANGAAAPPIAWKTCVHTNGTAEARWVDDFTQAGNEERRDERIRCALQQATDDEHRESRATTHSTDASA